MPFTYRAITANCGNDSIGKQASKQIAEFLDNAEDTDFVVVNCQEVDFEKAQKQLEDAVKKGYQVSCLGQMVTHTKPSTQLHSHTAIATFVIHKENIELRVEKSTEVRRKNTRLGGSAYNKGGLVTDFVVSKKEGPDTEEIRVQAISGHLDSNSLTKRNHDWHNLHKARSPQFLFTWNSLVNACPNLIISGYDANTRNKLEDGREVNLLEQRPDDPEVQALSRAAFGERHFSSAITYSKAGNEIEDPKRPGYAARGMLDYLAISDGKGSRDGIGDASAVGLEKDTDRDHYVLISPSQVYTRQETEFRQVRDQMVMRLEPVAPQLAASLRTLNNGIGDKLELISTYNKYLSKEGLLNKAIELHTQKLGVYNHFMKAPFLQDNETIKGRLNEVLFKDVHWCEGLPHKIVTQNALMKAFLTSLKHCNHQEGIQARLDFYEELKARVDNGFSVNKGKGFELNAVKEFKEFAQNEFRQKRDLLEQTLSQYNPSDKDEHGQKFKAAGTKILFQIDSFQQSMFSHKTLDMLTRVATESQKACAMVNGSATYDAKIVVSLSALSHESEKKSSLWEGICIALKIFTAVAAVIIGISPIGLIDNNKKDKLLHTVNEYKTKLHELTQPESPSEKNDNDDDHIIQL